MFDRIPAIRIGFPLNFLLGFVIVLLHIHEYGTHACQSGHNKRSREKYAGAEADNSRHKQTLFGFAGGLDLIRKTELIHTIPGRIDPLHKHIKQMLYFLRVFICNAHMVFIFSRVGNDSFLRPQIVTEGLF